MRYHDPLTGKSRSAANDRCNLMWRKTYKVPVFFHNFRGYDSHLSCGGSARSLGSTSTSSATGWRSTSRWSGASTWCSSTSCLSLRAPRDAGIQSPQVGEGPPSNLWPNFRPIEQLTHTSTCCLGRAYSPTSTSTHGRRCMRLPFQHETPSSRTSTMSRASRRSMDEQLHHAPTVTGAVPEDRRAPLGRHLRGVPWRLHSEIRPEPSALPEIAGNTARWTSSRIQKCFRWLTSGSVVGCHDINSARSDQQPLHGGI